MFRRLMFMVVVIGFMVLGGGPMACALSYNASPSLPTGLYWRVDREIARGSIVAACLPTELADIGLQRGYLGRGRCEGEAQAVGKRVAAVGGDLVEVVEMGVVVNGELLSASRPLTRDSGRRPMPVLPRRRYRMGSGQLWLIGDDPRSWDSRYFGPVSRSSVVAVVVPIWTWK